ncbi:RHS repeat-associated core domain-containing protein [Mangrovihabitans endophyticus]|uniref:RHS repeat-associated core domain-containing protein n=1 Tax=Mangrovihabitans endophyticus TaxID=1751298 RepID=A0A8J3FQV9_9ACTN|nr:RHS repeat-associated core domain-containing protein [Mangrovihabitans endophyticus]GGL01195.1 hypothetical protein GCM10012284_39700 [Mangrovihabitans endophyticus]
MAVGTAALLAACTGQEGTTAVLENPRPVVAHGAQHVAAEAPHQRWGGADGLNPVAGEPGNDFVPPSQRSRYPLLKHPARPANRASVVDTERTAAARAAANAATDPGFNARTSRERVGDRDAHRRVYDNADGTQTTEYSTAALNYRTADGGWAPIDAHLTGDAATGWQRTGDTVGLRLAPRADAAELVRVTLPGGGVLAYGAAGARGVTGRVDGDTATYRGVWPDVDVELQAQPGGVKETLVLGSAAAPHGFTFPLRLTGLSAAVDGAAVVLTDPAGNRRASIPAGYLVDASGAVSHAVRYRLVDGETGAALRVEADEDWLADPQRQFPVRLDPPVLADGAASQGLVVQGSSSHGGGDELLVGRRNGKNSASYLKFPGLVSDLRNHTIFSAQLSFANFSAPSCKPRTVSVHPVTGSWSAGDTDRSYPGPGVGSALASASVAQGYVALGHASSACPVTGTVINLGSKGRDLVQGWVNGKVANNGISLRAPVGDESAWKVIAGTGTANPPKLYVTHTPYNAKYSVPHPTPDPAVLQNQDGKVKVSVTNTSAMDWSASGYKLIYRAYNAKTNASVGQFVAASLPGTVARNAKVTLDATIRALPIGDYLLDFSMATSDGRVVFTDEMVPPARIALSVENIEPVVEEVYPPNGYASPILTPQLWARAIDLDAPPGSALQFRFQYCSISSSGEPTDCTLTPYQSGQAFTIPAGKLRWSTVYQWRAYVKDNADETITPYSTLITTVPQPEITSRVANAPYGSQDRDFDPDLGNFSTAAVDANVATAGPPLSVVRSYNSLDPRRDLAFGAGWMSQFDMRLVLDADGSGNALVTYPDGQQVRFGRNPDNTFAAPIGRTARLTIDAGAGTYQLEDSAGTTYRFRGGDGRIARITDKYSRYLEFSYTSAGTLSTAHSSFGNRTIGRSLTFGWNADNTHVTSVSTEPVGGRALTWTYQYDGDLLTRACSPGAVNCTTYGYAPGSHYRSGVLDAGPESYWRLGEDSGSTGAASEVGNNLGKDAGTAANVTFGADGALAGTDDTAGQFNGTTSMVELPGGTVKASRDTTVELWFKVDPTQTGGPLIGYQDKKLSESPGTGVPLLYTGSDGHLRGQFKTTSDTPVPMDIAVDVRDGKWHHAVLSVTADVQSLYLDGGHKATMPASAGVVDHNLLTANQLGAAWATNPTAWPRWGSTAKRTLSGSLDELAVYDHALSDQIVRSHWLLGTTPADQLSTVTLPSGRIASETAYDTAADRVTEYTDGNGGTWKIGLPTVYGGDTDLRRSVRVFDPADRPSMYEYDALANRLLRSASPIGLTTRPEDRPPSPAPSPSPSPSPTEVCSSPDPGYPQFCTHIPDDASGPIFEANELTGMAVRSYGYDALGRQNKIVDENGGTIELAHDARGNVTSRKTCRAPGDCQTTYTSYTTPSANNPLDPRNDLPVEVRDPRSASETDNTYRTTTQYTVAGDVSSETGPDGAITSTDYTSGNQFAVNPDVDFMPPGLPYRVYDTADHMTQFRYNAYGDTTYVKTQTAMVTESTYDALGRKVMDRETSDAYPDGVVTTYTYDDMGRLLTTTGPVTVNAVDGTRHQAVTTNTYDVDGNVIRTAVADALDPNEPERATTIEYDDYGHPTRTVNAEGDEQTEGWDRFGNRTSLVDGNGNHYGYAYTARNELAEVRLYDWHGDPDGAPAQDDDLGYVVLTSYAYDYGGRMAFQVDSMGRKLAYSYYDDGMLASIVLKNFHNPDGSTRDYVVEKDSYDDAGNLTRQETSNGVEAIKNTIDRIGRTQSTTYDPDGLNRYTTYGFDTLGNVTSTTQGGNPSNVPWFTPAGVATHTTHSYNSVGQLERDQVSDGSATRTTSYTYNQRGDLLTQTDARGNESGADRAAHTTTYQYDENGDPVRVSAPAVATESGGGAATTTRPATATGYNAFGEVVAVKDALGRITRNRYDRMGRLVEVTEPEYTAPGAPTTGATPVTTMAYDALGNVTEATDARGNVTRYTYDRLNRVVTRDEPAATNDERAVTRFTYTRTGQLLSTVGPTGIRTEATYDDLDRQVTATQFERQPSQDTFTSRMRYDDAGNLLQVTSPGGQVTTMSYNKIGELLTSIDPNGVTTRHGYDGFGNLVRNSDGAGRTTRRDYDLFGQVSAEIDLRPDGTTVREETYGYDANGNVTSRTNALGVAVTFQYDVLDRLVRQVEPTSASHSITTTFGYDAAGNRTRYTDGRQNSTYYTFNSMGLPESVVEPSTAAHPALADRTWTVGYDLNGNADRISAPGGVVRTRVYDAADRMIAENGSGAATSASRGITYDLADRPTAITASGNDDTYTYDDRGDLLTAAGVSGSASFAYDADGSMIRRTDAVGTATFGYRNGRLDSMTDAASGVTQKLGYNNAGLVDSIDYGQGRTRTFGYDDLGRLASDRLSNSGGSAVATVAYRYDLDDRLIGKDTTGTAGAGSNTYGYDDAGRLTSWTSANGTVDYAWDDSGNRTRAGAKTATYDQRNRLLSDGDYTYTYTPRGTMSGRTSSGLTDTYDFDAFDRLIGAEGQTYVYDGLNRVINRNGTLFSYAGTEQDPVGDGIEKFARGPDGELLAVEDQTDNTRITVSDEHDDVVAAFDADGDLNALDGSTAFDPYGQRIAESGDQSRVGYQGDWTDPDTGQVDMGARWYEPDTGGFTSRDTVGYNGGDSILANKYTYGAGDPLANTDPSGNWPSCGWCKRQLSKVWHKAQSAYNWGKRVVSTGLGYVKEGTRWLVSQGKAAYSAIKRGVTNVVNKAKEWGSWAWSKGKQGYQAAKSGYDRYVAPTLKRARDYAAAKAEQVHQAAVKVTQKAKAAINYAVKHVSIKRIGAAVKAGLKNIKVTVSAAIPAKLVQSYNAVVQDLDKAADTLYKAASAAGGALVDGVDSAADWVVDHKAAIIGGIAGTVVGLGCGLLIGATGVGAIACAAVGGAVGSLVTDLVEGGKGWKEMTADALIGGVIGGVMAPLTAIGGSAVTGAVRGMLSGGLRSAASMGRAAATNSLKSFGKAELGGLAGRMLSSRAGASAGREAAAEAAGACVGNSFAPATAVLMADGTTKRIEDVRVGDMVVATDPTTGRTEKRAVTALIIGIGVKQMVRLTVDVDGEAGDKTATIDATQGHPFWAPDLGKWVTADKLSAGSMLRTGAGTYVTVTATAKWTAQKQRVHNLSVDGLHTYYVLAGTKPVLVHNCPLSEYAESVRNKAGVKFASEYTSPSGAKYYGHNRHGQQAEGALAEALKRAAHHGGCAEVHCLIQAQAAEGADAIRGGTMRTLQTRNNSMPTSNTDAHGEVGRPCGRCSGLLKDLGID